MTNETKLIDKVGSEKKRTENKGNGKINTTKPIYLLADNNLFERNSEQNKFCLYIYIYILIDH